MNPRWPAFLASFFVYLLPLVGPHASWTIGITLAHDLSHAADRPFLWVAANCLTALLLQAAAGWLAWWIFRGGKWRMSALLAAVPALLIAANGLYLFLIPLAVLVERDSAPEQGEWPVACTAPDAALSPVRPALDPGVALIRRSQGIQFALLEMPGCRVRDLPAGIAYDNAYLAAGGALLHHAAGPAGGIQWWWTRDPAGPPVAIAQKAAALDGMPILSRDGQWAGWTVRPRPEQPALLLQRLGAPEETVVSLQPLAPGNFSLLDLDSAARRLVVLRNDRELFALDWNGSAQPLPFDLAGVEPQTSTVRLLPSGWVAWDAYKEYEAYRVGWSLPGGRGTHRAPRGRSFNSVAADPAGRYVAVSIGGNLSIGSVPDPVYVLRAADGVTVFRRTLPQYARSQVAFLAGGFFAYTHSSGSTSEVRVLRPPG